MNKFQLIARTVYDGLTAHGIVNEPFETYLSKGLAGITAGTHGGVVIVKVDRIGWIDIYCPQYAPRLRKMRELMETASFLDIDYLAADCEHSTNINVCRKICEKLGFQKLTSSLYSIGVQNYGAPFFKSITATVDWGYSRSLS